MKHAQIKDLPCRFFRRLTGVKKSTFDRMIGILQTAEQKQKARGGKPCKLSMQDRLLMCLEYLREYRTYFHISQGYGLSESSCYRTIRWLEDTLIKHPDFSLPGRKELLKAQEKDELMLIDATESPIERPKKDRNVITLGKRKDIRSKVS